MALLLMSPKEQDNEKGCPATKGGGSQWLGKKEPTKATRPLADACVRGEWFGCWKERFFANLLDPGATATEPIADTTPATCHGDDVFGGPFDSRLVLAGIVTSAVVVFVAAAMAVAALAISCREARRRRSETSAPRDSAQRVAPDGEGEAAGVRAGEVPQQPLEGVREFSAESAALAPRYRLPWLNVEGSRRGRGREATAAFHRRLHEFTAPREWSGPGGYPAPRRRGGRSVQHHSLRQHARPPPPLPAGSGGNGAQRPLSRAEALSTAARVTASKVLLAIDLEDSEEAIRSLGSLFACLDGGGEEYGEEEGQATPMLGDLCLAIQGCRTGEEAARRLLALVNSSVYVGDPLERHGLVRTAQASFDEITASLRPWPRHMPGAPGFASRQQPAEPTTSGYSERTSERTTTSAFSFSLPGMNEVLGLRPRAGYRQPRVGVSAHQGSRERFDKRKPVLGSKAAVSPPARETSIAGSRPVGSEGESDDLRREVSLSPTKDLDNESVSGVPWHRFWGWRWGTDTTQHKEQGEQGGAKRQQEEGTQSWRAMGGTTGSPASDTEARSDQKRSVTFAAGSFEEQNLRGLGDRGAQCGHAGGDGAEMGGNDAGSTDQIMYLRRLPVVHKVHYATEDEKILFGDGGLLAFFRDNYPGYYQVDEAAQEIHLSGQGAGFTPESSRACLEHGLRVCREGGFQPADLILLRLTVQKIEDTRDVVPQDMALKASEFVPTLSLTPLVQNFGCVGHYVDQAILCLAGPSTRQAVGRAGTRSPPGLMFAPALRLDRKEQRVLQLFGLRHCVRAAKEHVVALATNRVERSLRLGAIGVRCVKEACSRDGFEAGAVSFDVFRGELRVEGPEATNDMFELLLLLVARRLPFFRMVHIGSPILMRFMASDGAIENIVQEAGVFRGDVSILATWSSRRLLVWGADGRRRGHVDRVCDVLLRKVEAWKRHEVSVCAPRLARKIPHARRKSVPGDGDQADRDFPTWPAIIAEMSKAVGIDLWVDGIYIRGEAMGLEAERSQEILSAEVESLELMYDRAVLHKTQGNAGQECERGCGAGRGTLLRASIPGRRQPEPSGRDPDLYDGGIHATPLAGGAAYRGRGGGYPGAWPGPPMQPGEGEDVALAGTDYSGFSWEEALPC